MDTRAAGPYVSVVVPILNEVENIAPFYAEFLSATRDVPQLLWELIFVDDGSADGSLDKIAAIASTDSRVKAVQLSRNFGSHAALTAGMGYAAGDAVMVISVDLQDPPQLLSRFFQEWQRGYHIVWGVREGRRDPWGKTALATSFYWLCRRIALPNFPKGGMDCGMFDRRVVDVFLGIGDRTGYLFGTLLWCGFRQAHIQYVRGARLRGRTKWSLPSRIKAALDLIVSFSYVPIRFMSYLGLGISLISVLYACDLVVERLIFGAGAPGWPSIMVAVLFLGGLQLIMLGVLGEYVWRTLEQVRGRPAFIVMREIGLETRKLRGLTGENDPPQIYRVSGA